MTDVLKNTRVVLCGPRHPGNIGAAARAMKTMGLSELALVNPPLEAHLSHLSHEAVRRASRAEPLLRAARVCASLDEALQGVGFAVACSARARGLAVPALDARAAVLRLAGVAAAQPVALVFGNESSGLSTEEVNRCQLLAFIPVDAEYGSLNLAAAVQVMAYELRMASGAGTAGEAGEAAGSAEGAAEGAEVLASHEELEALYAHLEGEFVTTGFMNPEQPRKLMPRVRRLFARAQLTRDEVNIVRGAVRTLRSPKKR